MTEKEQTQISIKMSLDGIRDQAKKEQYWNCIARTRSLLDLFCKEFDKILILSLEEDYTHLDSIREARK